MGITRRLAASAAAVALLAGLTGGAWAASPGEIADAVNAIFKSKSNGSEITLGTPTQENGNIVFKDVVIKDPHAEDTKIGVLTFANANVADGGKKVTADAVVAELVTGGADKDTFAIDQIELTNPVLSAKDEDSKIDSVALNNITITPAGKKPVTIASAGFDLGDFANDIPHSVDLSIEGMNLDPASLDDTGSTAAQLKAIGYDKLELSFYGSGSLDQSNGNLTIEEITIDGTDIGSLTLSGELSGVTDDILKSLGKNEMTPEIAGKVNVKSASLYYGDASLAGRLIAMQAKAAGQEPGAFVDQITGALPLMLSMIGNPGFQDKLAKGATTFLKDPKNLQISAAPEKPLSLIELFGLAQTAPQTLPDVLKADVLANQDEQEDDGDVDSGDAPAPKN